MDPGDIKEKIQQEVLGNLYPELSGVEPEVESGPSESQLRALRRRRAVISDGDLQQIPVEHRFIYRVDENDERPFDQTIVVVTDDEGNTQFIIESR
jgi:hypothetical protein